MAADGLPGRPVVYSAGGWVDAAELRRRARRVAAALRATDCDHVGYLGLNSSAFPLALLGATLAGRPFVPLNYRLSDAALRAQVQRLAPVVVVVDDAMAARVSCAQNV